MSRKSFNICVALDILDVTCPGVWICPKGMVYLDIWLFGSNSSTSYAEPRFPLAFNETFNFHENLAELVNLRDVQNALEEKYVMRIALVQVHKKKQITLATYKSSVDEVLYPEPSRLRSNGELALLMKNEPLFPGTISPKITLVTKTSVTEQIITIPRDDHHMSQLFSESPQRPNRMKRVHHTKSINSQCFHRGEHRVCNDDESTNTDSESGSQQLYCRNHIKTDNIKNCECHLKKSCKHCENINGLRTTKHINETSNQKNIKTLLEFKRNSLNDDKYQNTETTSNNLSKNIKATIKAHHYNCCKTKLNSSGSNESIKTSEGDSIHEEKNMHKSGEDRKKMKHKIKAQLHLDVYPCRCNKPNQESSPSWRNICNEVNRRDTMGDEIKYNMSLRNYYRRLYDGATYQLSRNLKLL